MAGVANLTNAGKGRPKGSKNKQSAAIRDQIIAALDKAGGIDYLLSQARENPTAFLGLVGKVLPMQVAGDPDQPLSITIRNHIVRAGD